MKNTIFRLSLSVLLSTALVAAAFALPKALDPPGLNVHEWGTFTSVAGENGTAMTWQPFGGPTDLPCFVDRFRGFKSEFRGVSLTRCCLWKFNPLLPKPSASSLGVWN